MVCPLQNAHNVALAVSVQNICSSYRPICYIIVCPQLSTLTQSKMTTKRHLQVGKGHGDVMEDCHDNRQYITDINK